LQEGNLRLQGMLCVGSENVHFHESGKISSAVLAEDLLIDGQWYPKGTRLAFDEDGKIIPRETESPEGG